MMGESKPLELAFFQRDAETVARNLIGCVMVRTLEDEAGGRVLKARIVETEAYVGVHDLACHASKGRTSRTEVMFRPGGRAYVYLIYGMHQMLNVVTGTNGDGQAILIRAAEALTGWEGEKALPDMAGPGKFARVMQITPQLNGIEVTGKALHFLKGAGVPPMIKATPRIGVEYAGTWAAELLRFYDAKSPAVSKVKPRKK